MSKKKKIGFEAYKKRIADLFVFVALEGIGIE